MRRTTPRVGGGGAAKLSISNSIFRNTNQAAVLVLQPKGASSQVDLSNVLIKMNANDANQNGPNGWVAFGVRANYPNISVNISNSIIHGYSTWHQTTEPSILTFQMAGKLTATRNIFICDINDANYMYMTRANNSTGIGTSVNVNSDYNVYILVRGKGFQWLVDPNNNNESNISTLPQWQALSGQDKHSLFVDLRNNPLGLKAVFTDPANGNWSYASTDVAATVKAMNAGMSAPPLYYPQRPVIGNDLSFANPWGFSSFSGQNKSSNESLLEWKTFNEREVLFFVVENSTDSLHYTAVDSVKAAGGGIDNSYQYAHQHTELPENYYRLKIVRSDSSFFYSPIVLLKTKIRKGAYLDVFPNPFQNTITIEHPSRPNASMSLYDLNGRLLKRVKVPAGVVQSRLQLTEMNKGIFILQWSTDTETVSKMILR